MRAGTHVRQVKVAVGVDERGNQNVVGKMGAFRIAARGVPVRLSGFPGEEHAKTPVIAFDDERSRRCGHARAVCHAGSVQTQEARA